MKTFVLSALLILCLASTALASDPRDFRGSLSDIPAVGPCSFYLDMEKVLGCELRDDSHSNYLVSFGYKYCVRFKTLEQDTQDKQLQVWIRNTMSCLQRDLREAALEADLCPLIPDLAFAQHKRCYVESGICALNGFQRARVAREILNLDMLDYPKLYLLNLLETQISCWEKREAATMTSAPLSRTL